MKLLIKEGYSSTNLYNKVMLLEKAAVSNMAYGMAWVKQHAIDACLIGGTAVVNYLHGGRNLTPDVDYLVSNMNDVRNKLTSDGIQFSPIKDNNGGGLGITVPKFNIDFLDPNSGNKFLNQVILRSKINTNIGGATVSIIRPELLAIMKLELGRQKDLDDAFALLQSGQLDKQTYIKFVEGLRGKLSDYESIRSYAELIK